MLEEIKNGKNDERLREIYVDESVIGYQRERYAKAVESFYEKYGKSDIEIYSAPGRSEIGGNHTDHQHGEVLAASVNLDAIAVVRPSADGIIKMYSEGYGECVVDTKDCKPVAAEEGTTLSLIKGVVAGFMERGYNVGGYSAYVTSDVLGGAGLSSSAAYEVLVGTILSGLYNEMKISPVVIAQVAQYAENKFFGKPCGLMDQMASSVGNLIHIDFKDPGEPVIEKVDADFEKFGVSLCIVDTKGDHKDLTPDYAAIPSEMKAVAKELGKEVLRDVDEAEFTKKMPLLRAKLGDRPLLRAIHFFNEDRRVREQVAALKAGDYERFAKEIEASGNSSFKYLQNVYTSNDVMNQAVSMGLAVSENVLKGKGVCRVHGGGFAGTIQAFVPNAVVPEYKAALDALFGEGSCHVLKVRPYGGIKF